MIDKKQNILLHVYAYGELIGLLLIISPIAKDILLKGAREWNVISIGTIGVIVQVIGVILILIGKRSEHILDQLTRPRR